MYCLPHNLNSSCKDKRASKNGKNEKKESLGVKREKINGKDRVHDPTRSNLKKQGIVTEGEGSLQLTSLTS